MAKRRPIQRFVIEFPGPTPRESEPVSQWELEETLRYAMECARHNGITNDQSIFYAKLDKLEIKSIDEHSAGEPPAKQRLIRSGERDPGVIQD